MDFSFDFDIPSKEEILAVKRLAKSNPEELDSRELWVLEQSMEGEDDD